MAIVDAAVKLNAIHATASNAYQTTIPLATADNIVDVGEAVLTAPTSVQNEFYDALVNLIGLQLIHTVDFTNPLSDLKKGKMEYGMTIEDIFVEMSRGQKYIAGTRSGESAPDQFEITKADVKAAFYSTQFERQYTKTLHQQDVKRAFRSADPVGTLTSAVMQSLRSGEEYDDYRMTLALVARQLEEAESATAWNGRVNLLSDYNTLNSTTLTPEQAVRDQDFLEYASEVMQTWSDRLRYVRSDLNIAGVDQTLPKPSQHIMMLGDMEAKFRVHLHTWAYNKDQLALGSVRTFDAWYSIGADSTSTPVVSPDDITVKGDLGLGGTDPCIAVLFDPDMLKIYNKENITENARNARAHYSNIWHTVADIYAASPYHNFVAFYLA
ncbi:MAG: hypothetical protein EOM07_11195 [Clostridia bacterium]|nr:hypothetical protein [Clostridia bacterium]